jgi:hypothetical protein
VARYILMMQGYKMNKGLGFAMKSALASLPLIGLITFFMETKYVLGFMGDACFCNFEPFWTRVDESPYYCMKDVG